METTYHFDTSKVIQKLGLDKNGRCQKILDSEVQKWLRQEMPKKNYIMSANTRIVEPGLIRVGVPYAHYMNEGKLYVMPKNGKGAYFNSSYGFWSEPGKKKVDSGKPLKYSDGLDHSNFVEKTIHGHYDDILEAVKKGVNSK